MVDSAEHTVAACEAWTTERAVLKEAIGDDLSMGAIVKTMCGLEETWKAVIQFSETVMQTKETAERERQAAEWARNSCLQDSGSSATD